MWVQDAGLWVCVCHTLSVFNSIPVEYIRPLGHPMLHRSAQQLLDNFQPYPVEQNGSDCRQAIPHVLYRLLAIVAILFYWITMKVVLSDIRPSQWSGLFDRWAVKHARQAAYHPRMDHVVKSFFDNNFINIYAYSWSISLFFISNNYHVLLCVWIVYH